MLKRVSPEKGHDLKGSISYNFDYRQLAIFKKWRWALETSIIRIEGSKLGQVLDYWEQNLQLRVDAHEITHNTLTTYTTGVARFLAWQYETEARSMDPETIRAWKADLLKQSYSPATVNTWLCGLKSLLDWAAEQGHLPYDPADKIKLASRKGTTKGHKREALTDEEVRAVLDLPDPVTPAGKRDLALLTLMLYTGIRSIEAHRSNLADLRTVSGRMVLYVTGKGHDEADEFVVIASREAQQALHKWIAARGRDPGPLFTSQSNRNPDQRLGLRSIRGIVKTYLNLAGVTNLERKTTHSLRHTAISKAIQGGAPVHKAQRMARHASIQTTMIYVHEADRLSNPAEEMIDYG
jgi:integrase/recombinase XerD